MAWDKIDRRFAWFALRRMLAGRTLDVYLHLLNYAWREVRKVVREHNTEESLISLGPHVTYREMVVVLGTGKHQIREALDRLERLGWICQLTNERAPEPAYLLGTRERVAAPQTKKGWRIEDRPFAQKTLDEIEAVLAPEVQARRLRGPARLPLAVRMRATELVLASGASEHQLAGSLVPVGTSTGASGVPAAKSSGAAGTPAASSEPDASCEDDSVFEAAPSRKRQRLFRDKGSPNLSEESPERAPSSPTTNSTTDRPTPTPSSALCSVPRLSRHGRSRQSGELSAMSMDQAA